MRLWICTNSKPGLCHSKISGHSASCCFQTGAWESPGWMNGRPVWKGFCDQPPYLPPAVREPIVTSPCASAISSPHLSFWRWASCLLWGLVTQGLTGAGNSQVTVNVGDCCLVCSISHHNANNEPSTQHKSSAQLPSYGDLRLQKQVCQNAGRKPAPLPPLSIFPSL